MKKRKKSSFLCCRIYARKSVVELHYPENNAHRASLCVSSSCPATEKERGGAQFAIDRIVQQSYFF